MAEDNSNPKDGGGAGKKRRGVTIDATPTKVELIEETVVKAADDAVTAAEATTEAPVETVAATVESVAAEAASAAEPSSELKIEGDAIATPTDGEATAGAGDQPVAEAAVDKPAAEPVEDKPEAKVETPAEPAVAILPPVAAKRPSVVVPALASGLVGGAVALGLGYGALVMGYLPAGGGASEDLTKAKAALAQLQAKVDELAAQPKLSAKDAATLGELPNRIAALEKRPAETGGGAAEAIEKLKAEVNAQIGTQIEAVKQAVAARQATIDQINSDFAKLKDDVAARAAQAGQAGQQALAQGQQAGQQAVSGAQVAAEKALADLTKRLQALEARPPVDVAAATEALRKAQDEVRQKVAALEAETKGMADKLGAATTQKVNEAASALLGKVDQQVATVKQAIDGVSGKVGTLEKSAGVGMQARDQATLAVALGALKSAIDAGRPYAAELATAKSLARDMVDLSALDVTAASGVLPGPVIVERFQPVARKILDAYEQSRGGTSFMDRLWLNAQQIVRVRPTGEVAGDGVPERIARIEARLTAGDLGGAAAEWKKLPDDSRKIGAEWGAALEARVGAAQAIDAVNRAVLSTLSKPAG